MNPQFAEDRALAAEAYFRPWLARAQRLSEKAQAQWARLLRQLFHLRWLQRLFSVSGTFLKGYPRTLLDRLSHNLTRS